jgi:MFS family permease
LLGGALGAGIAAIAAFAAAEVAFAVGETFLSPSLQPIVNDLAPDELRGRYNGTFTMATTTGFVVGPAIAGFALEAGRETSLFVLLIVGCALLGISSLRLGRHLPAHADGLEVAVVAA